MHGFVRVFRLLYNVPRKEFNQKLDAVNRIILGMKVAAPPGIEPGTDL
jgi:hypothetical protein